MIKRIWIVSYIPDYDEFAMPELFGSEAEMRKLYPDIKPAQTYVGGDGDLCLSGAFERVYSTEDVLLGETAVTDGDVEALRYAVDSISYYWGGYDQGAEPRPESIAETEYRLSSLRALLQKLEEVTRSRPKVR